MVIANSLRPMEPTLRERAVREFEKLWGVNRAEGQVLPKVIEAELDILITLTAEETKEYIEAECEWVKEDAVDGNDGYFKVRPSDLKAITDLKLDV